MTLSLSHFDTKLKQNLHVEEPIKNCLAEYLFPDAKFALGEINPIKADAKDLQEYQGMSLQLSSGKRMYFSDQPIREQVYPNPSDGAAYGSLLFTPCQKFSVLNKVKVLVIDDTTGDSNGILPVEEAKRLVGDCYGKMSVSLAKQLTERNNAPFQFRLGIKPQKESPVTRIGKGTLAPDSRLGDKTKIRYELILPTSSFKGRKGQDAIKPGEYTLDIGIGVKSIAEYGKQSLGPQVLVNYPKGVKEDLLPILQDKADKLAKSQGDIHSLAEHFVKTYKERAKYQAEVVSDNEGEITSLDGSDAEPDESETTKTNEKNLYALLEKDLKHHGQLLEHPYVIGELQKFLQRQWKDIALGRAIKFQSALAQPNLDLKEDEVCVPRMPDGAELIVTRSPLVNSNGVIVLKNRHVPYLMRTDGSIHINPVTAALHLQADFDGDRLAFERAEKYPNLSSEIKESLRTENRYPDVVKRDKLPYKGSFEEIAVSAVQNDIGKIANQIMSAVTLRWETTLMPDEEKKGYVQNVAQYYRGLLAKDTDPKNEFKIPEPYRKEIQSIANLSKTLTPENIETTLQTVRDIQFKIVGELSNELQVAVDGPKSASRPQSAVMNACRQIGGYQSVNWLKEKKNPLLYQTTALQSSNHSPIDLMAKSTNEKWQQNRLIARPIVQFRSLFSDTVTPQLQEKAQVVKETYNGYLKTARSLEDLKTQYPELIDPYIEVQVPLNQKIVFLTRLERFGTLNSELVSPEKPLNLSFVKNTSAPDIPNPILAVTTLEVNGKTEEKIIGAVAFSPGQDTSIPVAIPQAKVTLRPGVTEERIQGVYKELDNYVDLVRQSNTGASSNALASALWHNAHSRDEHNTRKALIAFKIFPNEVLKQVEQLQFTELKVVGLHFSTNEYGNKQWKGEEVNCEIVLHPIPDKTGQLEDKRILKVEGLLVAPLTNESPSLPVGTTFKASLTAEPSSGVVATSPKGNTLIIGQIKNFTYRDKKWQGESEKITVTMVKPDRGKQVPLVTLNNHAIGILDRESEKKLRELNLLNDKGFTLTARLEPTPVKSAQADVKPETVVYPWQQKEQQQQIEEKRGAYRQQYDTYVAEFINNPTFTNAPRKEIDVEVAIRATADGQDKIEVMSILAQSDLVRAWRETVPSNIGWDDYVKQARDYVRIIQDEANKRLRAKCPETVLLLMLSILFAK